VVVEVVKRSSTYRPISAPLVWVEIGRYFYGNGGSRHGERFERQVPCRCQPTNRAPKQEAPVPDLASHALPLYLSACTWFWCSSRALALPLSHRIVRMQRQQDQAN
jgi:hypothetical protein